MAFRDWPNEIDLAESLLAQNSVKVATITVTESGHHLDNEGHLNPDDATIRDEINGDSKSSVYAYLEAALARRATEIDKPLTIACCDNLRGNGDKLRCNFLTYLALTENKTLADWVRKKVVFPNSMVDRITPRKADDVQSDAQALFGANVDEVVQSEAFSQWVLEDYCADIMPDISIVGVEIVHDVDLYEEAKIHILNGRHTCLAYLAALKGHQTFDQAMQDDELAKHFRDYEQLEVLPALPADIPLDTTAYLDNVEMRFSNNTIADSIERICADGFAKFQIFIRPTIEAVLENGDAPIHAIRSIASWYWFAQAVKDQRISFEYYEPSWDVVSTLLEPGQIERFATSNVLWSDLPKRFPQFSILLKQTIVEMEKS
ncbi:hypothetical protein [Maritalea sp.]|uniref:mannitol dehydrogenase family protein n=1 Tax=Maritalea sp. TaxID=2003361 RepID=UPI003EF4D6BA